MTTSSFLSHIVWPSVAMMIAVSGCKSADRGGAADAQVARDAAGDTPRDANVDAVVAVTADASVERDAATQDALVARDASADARADASERCDVSAVEQCEATLVPMCERIVACCDEAGWETDLCFSNTDDCLADFHATIDCGWAEGNPDVCESHVATCNAAYRAVDCESFDAFFSGSSEDLPVPSDC